MEGYGQRIKHLRKLHGMTQEKFADHVGVSRNTVGNWEIDRTSPSMEDMERVCSATGCTLIWLIYGDEGMMSIGDLTQAELLLLQDFRRASDAGKVAILTTAGHIRVATRE